MEIVEFKKETLEGSLLLVGFPGRGLVGPTVASYIVEELDMWPVAAVLDPSFPPTVAVREGRGEAPIQFYVSAERCGPDGACDKLVVLRIELPLRPEQSNALAAAVLGWAKEKGIRMVATVEGIEVPEAQRGDDGAVPLFGVSSGGERLNLEGFEVEALPDGVITSHSSACLLLSRALGLDLVALFVGAQEDQDQLAAAEVLSRVDPVVPHLNLAADEFRQKVDRHQSERRRRQEDQAKQLKGLQRSYEMMYQ